MDKEIPMKLEQKSSKILVGFLGDLKTIKFHSETKWPLAFYFSVSYFDGQSFKLYFVG